MSRNRPGRSKASWTGRSPGHTSARSDAPQAIGSVLGELSGTGPWVSGAALGRLGRRWSEVVGERLAAECAPVRLDRGNLVVGATSAAWATQLRFLAGEIRRRADEVAGPGSVASLTIVVRDPAAGREGDGGHGR